MNEDAAGERRRFSLKGRNFEALNERTKEGQAGQIDVYAILKRNRQVADAFEKPTDISKRPSRRKRDYIYLLVLGDALFGIVIIMGGENVIVLVCGLSGMLLFTVCLTWLMWGVMGDY